MQIKGGIALRGFEADVDSLRLSDTNTGMEILKNMSAMQLRCLLVGYLFVLLISCHHNRLSVLGEHFHMLPTLRVYT